MKRTLIFMACMLASVVMQAQEESNDYIPFVQNGKVWHVVRSAFNEGYHFEQYMLSGEEVVKDDKTYMKMYRRENNLTEIYDVALFICTISNNHSCYPTNGVSIPQQLIFHR